VISIEGFACSDFTHDGTTRAVYRAGAGPAVIVMHELPGLHPGVLAFARRVIAAGFTVYAPSLVGTPGRPMSASYAASSIARVCVAREFATWALRTTSPIIAWLRALARDARAACGGQGVGAVGMCLTGGFALAMAVDDIVRAPVLSQPSLPFPLTAAHRRDAGISEADFAAVCARDVSVLGLRFTHDLLTPAARFATLRDRLGDRFVAIEIDSGPGNAHGIPRRAHSVLAFDYVDAPEHPTRRAADEVIALFRRTLA
jgi:dienelactone hydrolase